jgi:hypothetical protein
VSHYLLNDDGTTTPTSDYRLAWDSAKNRSQIASDIINGERVSTVFLVIDHNHLGQSPLPLLFETMIFCGSDRLDATGAELNERQWRYATKAEALAGHAAAADLLADSFAVQMPAADRLLPPSSEP